MILPQLNMGLLSDYKICGDSECESKSFNVLTCVMPMCFFPPCFLCDAVLSFFHVSNFKYLFLTMSLGHYACVGPMSRVQAIRDHPSKDCRFLSFRRGDTIFVYHKLTGKRDDLWAGSVCLICPSIPLFFSPSFTLLLDRSDQFKISPLVLC